jgi:hypothetical protein
MDYRLFTYHVLVSARPFCVKLPRCWLRNQGVVLELMIPPQIGWVVQWLARPS